MAEHADYYDILEIDSTASDKEVRDAFRRLTKLYHPDKHSNSKHSHKKYIKIVEAFNVLSDNNNRQQYDMERGGNAQPFSRSYNNRESSNYSRRDNYKMPYTNYFLNSTEHCADYLSEVGLSYLNAQNYEKAVEYFDLALNGYPRKPIYYIYKGEVLLKLNLIKEALACFEKCLRIEPGNIKAINNRNHVLNLMKGRIY